MRRQPTDWEKIFSNKVTSKELISNIYKQLMQLNIKKKKKKKKKKKTAQSKIGQKILMEISPKKTYS